MYEELINRLRDTEISSYMIPDHSINGVLFALDRPAIREACDAIANLESRNANLETIIEAKDMLISEYIKMLDYYKGVIDSCTKNSLKS